LNSQDGNLTFKCTVPRSPSRAHNSRACNANFRDRRAARPSGEIPERCFFAQASPPAVSRGDSSNFSNNHPEASSRYMVSDANDPSCRLSEETPVVSASQGATASRIIRANRSGTTLREPAA
jgi:hypothetical protein